MSESNWWNFNNLKKKKQEELLKQYAKEAEQAIKNKILSVNTSEVDELIYKNETNRLQASHKRKRKE